ncbi:MAG: hypothetical protein ABSG86_07500 [Thermoguttaceae bacterium]|jgi:hypothetical protein
MNAETIREWLNRRPFELFELRLSKGEAYQVRHPEVLANGRGRIAIFDPETDHFVHVALIHINSIQALQTA